MNKIEKILITGITGFVGSHLADYISENHSDVIILGLARWRSPVNNIKHLIDNNKITLVYGDLTDSSSLHQILSKHRPDVIFHLAAQSYVPYSFDAPISTLNSNVIGTANLLEEIKKVKLQSKNHNCKYMLYDPIVHICSSSEVYGQVNPDEVPIKESNQFRPASPYAVSKVGEDMLALQYWLSWGIKTIRTRMFTHTGPRRGEVFATSTFAKQIAEIESWKSLTSTIKVGNLDSVRTFLDVGDAVRAYWILVNKCTPGEVYNIGGNETMTVGEMLKKLLNLSTRKDIKIEIDPSRLRPSDVTLQIPCTDKFRNETGWKPEVPFDKTLENLLNYWRNEIAK